MICVLFLEPKKSLNKDDITTNCSIHDDVRLSLILVDFIFKSSDFRIEFVNRVQVQELCKKKNDKLVSDCI